MHAVQIRSITCCVMGKRPNRDKIANRIDQGLKEETRLAFFNGIARNHRVKLSI